MADDASQPMMIDAASLMNETNKAALGEVAPSTAAEDPTDIVSQAFTSVEQDGSEVQYVTMTPEEAAAAGVMEDDQVVTTSLQFDPANPSVLYTADGTLINRSDLSPEEQALVQAALQQHLAEQEAEQQLAAIDQQQGGVESVGGSLLPSTTTSAEMMGSELIDTPHMVSSASDLAATTMSNVLQDPAPAVAGTNVNLASPNTNAAQIVQTLANNVRRQQEYAKAQTLLNQAKLTDKPPLPAGYRYEEKIVIRQGQPHVMKMPVKNTPPTPSAPKKPELPAALANLMPKVEVGKDGSQVIRIHQSQITAEQLKSLQENPNVRLVFRPAGSQSRVPGRQPVPSGPARKRGRPRKTPAQYHRGMSPTHDSSAFIKSSLDESPPTKTSRYGRMSKQPYYQKDYLSTENGGVEQMEQQHNFHNREMAPKYHHQPSTQHAPVPGRRGRPPGSVNKSTAEKAYRRGGSYANRMEMLREQQLDHDEEISTSRLSIVPQKPVLSSVEQAISSRRKNRLRELLSACSEDEIMEVALPHLARVFSLWEFLIMKVEKNKLSRVYFADVYKEYEALHKYVSRLTELYIDSVEKRQGDDVITDVTEELEKQKRNAITIKCKKLAESLGLHRDELEDAFISLLDTKQPAIKPPTTVSDQIVPEISAAAAAEAANDNQMVFTGAAGQLTSTTASAADMMVNAGAAISAPVLLPVPGESPATEAQQQMEQQQQATTGQAEIPPLAPLGGIPDADTKQQGEAPSGEVASAPASEQQIDNSGAEQGAAGGAEELTAETLVPASTNGAQIIQIGTGDDKQFIEVPEGYTLIQTPNGLVMSQPGTTLSQGEDGTIYVTHEDGTTAPLDSQKGVPLETVESLLSLDGQQ